MIGGNPSSRLGGKRPAAIEPEGAVGQGRGNALGIGRASDAREGLAEDRVQADAVAEVRTGHARRLGLNHRHPTAGDIDARQLLEGFDLGGWMHVMTTDLLG